MSPSAILMLVSCIYIELGLVIQASNPCNLEAKASKSQHQVYLSYRLRPSIS